MHQAGDTTGSAAVLPWERGSLCRKAGRAPCRRSPLHPSSLRGGRQAGAQACKSGGQRSPKRRALRAQPVLWPTLPLPPKKMLPCSCPPGPRCASPGLEMGTAP